MNKQNAELNLNAAARPTSSTRPRPCSSPQGISSRRTMSSSAFVRSVPALFNMQCFLGPDIRAVFFRHVTTATPRRRTPLVTALPAASMVEIADFRRHVAMSRRKRLLTFIHDSWKMKSARTKCGNEMQPPGYRTTAPHKEWSACIYNRQSSNGAKTRTIC